MGNNIIRDKKPLLTVEELVDKMNYFKGIRFDIVSKEEAKEYLLNTNNYFRTASYRKNYEKYQKGDKVGKYVDLDFAYLKDLSSIDFHLREIILNMCIDIEHDLKIRMLADVESTEDNGYAVVDDFLSKNNYILQNITLKRASSYTSDLINKYFSITENNGKCTVESYDCPIWIFLEIISFGEFIRFYEFFYEKNGNCPINKKFLNVVKSLRNACAHNNCLIYNLHSSNAICPLEIRKEVAKLSDISKDMRKNRLSSRFVMEFVTLLYVYKSVVVSKVQSKRIKQLVDLYDNRMLRNKEYYAKNDLLISNYKFTYIIIQKWFK